MSDQHVLVGGRYRLGNSIGRGGMSEIRLGLDTHLGRVVAVKRLDDQHVNDPVARYLLETEARSTARMNHPAIVRVFDTGEERDPLSGEATPYLVMELVPGQPLSSLVSGGKSVPPLRALALIRKVLEALAHSHAAGVVHRDIKPSNVMLTPTGDIKIMDFGISREIAAQRDDEPNVMDGFGSTKYLSPEQARHSVTDSRSDIYSAGCVLYELLVGRPPFSGDTHEVIYQHLLCTPTAPSEINRALDHTLDDVVLRALAKEPRDRYASAEDMIAAIDDAVEVCRQARGRGLADEPPLVGQGATWMPVPRPPTGGRAGHRSLSHRVSLLASGLVAALLPLAGFGFLGDASAPVQNAASAELRHAPLTAAPGPAEKHDAKDPASRTSATTPAAGTGGSSPFAVPRGVPVHVGTVGDPARAGTTRASVAPLRTSQPVPNGRTVNKSTTDQVKTGIPMKGTPTGVPTTGVPTGTPTTGTPTTGAPTTDTPKTDQPQPTTHPPTTTPTPKPTAKPAPTTKPTTSKPGKAHQVPKVKVPKVKVPKVNVPKVKAPKAPISVPKPQPTTAPKVIKVKVVKAKVKVEIVTPKVKVEVDKPKVVKVKATKAKLRKTDKTDKTDTSDDTSEDATKVATEDS